ncbi:hypothetical protein PAXRUDRAFT_22331 [Paxillus rubicundulus Ve08.2h10]|uniref:Unplaced genomic scaffold scaffold_6348, whole genome shotgun sequence n=1 Tax=Paxillus rubicundulus Ve08.2h10 TaxID=930991 RepID=A0A0D0CXM7_9AGAM|nr:hypothetical protein PAXRUDRAFT_22331 [Paxillus rubicundulus Ve08.2h10]
MTFFLFPTNSLYLSLDVQQAYKLLDVECRTTISSRHVTFDKTGTISARDLAPWNVPTVEGQWEGLLLRQHKAEHEDVEEETPELGTPDLCRTVGVNNAPPDALEAQRPPSPTIDDLTNCFEQLHMDPPLAPAPAPAPVPVRPQPPSPERPAPAQIVAGVQRSNRQCQQADWNQHYQWTVNEDAA